MTIFKSIFLALYAACIDILVIRFAILHAIYRSNLSVNCLRVESGYSMCAYDEIQVPAESSVEIIHAG